MPFMGIPVATAAITGMFTITASVIVNDVINKKYFSAGFAGLFSLGGVGVLGGWLGTAVGLGLQRGLPVNRRQQLQESPSHLPVWLDTQK